MDAAAAAWLRGEDSPGTAGTVLSNAYQQSVWVYRAISILAEQVANIPFLFSRGERGREHLIASGPLHDFYSRPHSQMNRFQYWELRVTWLMLRGECFRIPIYDDAVGTTSTSSETLGNSISRTTWKSSLPTSIHQSGNQLVQSPRRVLKKVLMLDPANFHHIVEDGQLVGWRYTGGGRNAPLESQVFLPEEVWFEKLPNPFDYWRGLPPLLVASMAAKTDFAAAAYMRGLMENNADAGLIVRSDQQLGEEQREQIKATLRNRKKGGGVADRPILLWGVNEIVKPELSSADLQFLENRKFSRAEICAAFGIPEEIVTVTDNAKYDVMAGSRLNFIENRVIPLCARLEAEENNTTVPAIVRGSDVAASNAHGLSIKNQSPDRHGPKIENVIGWFDVDSLPLMQAARRDRLDAASAGFAMGIPFNELNKVFDLGFKSLPWGDNGYLPSKLRVAGESSSSSASASASSLKTEH